MQGIPLRRWRTWLAVVCALLLVVAVALPVGLAPVAAAPPPEIDGTTFWGGVAVVNRGSVQ